MNELRRCGIYTQWNNTQPLKKNKKMPFVATWKVLETLILSEVNQKVKVKYYMVSLISGICIWHK